MIMYKKLTENIFGWGREVAVEGKMDKHLDGILVVFKFFKRYLIKSGDQKN